MSENIFITIGRQLTVDHLKRLRNFTDITALYVLHLHLHAHWCAWMSTNGIMMLYVFDDMRNIILYNEVETFLQKLIWGKQCLLQ